MLNESRNKVRSASKKYQAKENILKHPITSYSNDKKENPILNEENIESYRALSNEKSNSNRQLMSGEIMCFRSNDETEILNKISDYKYLKSMGNDSEEIKRLEKINKQNYHKEYRCNGTNFIKKMNYETEFLAKKQVKFSEDISNSDLIQKTKNLESGFFLHNTDALIEKLIALDATGKNVILIGVTYALLDLIEQHKFQLKNTIIMETGGMKGKRKELIREELHAQLCSGFGVSSIHSEYGMTELLSQAYSLGNGIFECPTWMQILIRDTEDALNYVENGKTGGINVIDLANINSCSFIATQDLGKKYPNNSFEILGRFDNSDIRGCNLMVI